MNKEKVIKITDITILIAVAVLTAVFAFVDLFSEKYVIDYSFLACVLLFAITIHFIASAFLEMDMMKKHQDISAKLDNAQKTIIDSLKGVEIKLFDKIEDVDIYISQRILSAKKSVFDLNWQDYHKTNPSPRNPAVREYTESELDKSIKEFCADTKSKVYREIFTFSYQRNFQKMLTHITYGDKYSCSYYDNKAHPKFPKLQFVIIDDEEVIFVSSAYKPHFCAIRDKRIVSIFNNYFDQAWELSKVIKEKGNTKNDIIEKIKTTYIKEEK